MLRNLLPTSGWTPLPQVVARRLQQMLLDGGLKAGDRIPSQRILSDQFNVSRASLREAPLTLETLALIKTSPGRGTFVAAGLTTPKGAPKGRDCHNVALADGVGRRPVL